MSTVQCPKCGNPIDVPGNKAVPWAIGCLVAFLVIPTIIGIVGMLAAIAIPSFVKARQSAQMALCVSNMRQMEAARELQISTSASSPDTEEIGTVIEEHVDEVPSFVCPAGGTYTLNPVDQPVACSFHGTSTSPQPFSQTPQPVQR